MTEDIIRECFGVSELALDIKAPVITSATLNQKEHPHLEWAPVNGAVQYEIYRSEGKEGPMKKMFSTAKTSYTNTEVTAGTLYRFRVWAIGEDGLRDTNGLSEPVEIKVN